MGWRQCKVFGCSMLFVKPFSSCWCLFFCLCRSRVILDDFREAYYWLRQNTDDNARIMSWWDYGYQIAGMGNKTTLVDNNTWNNSHIALVSANQWNPSFQPVKRGLPTNLWWHVLAGWQGHVVQRVGCVWDNEKPGCELCPRYFWWSDWLFWRRHQQVPVDGSHCRRRTPAGYSGQYQPLYWKHTDSCVVSTI